MEALANFNKLVFHVRENYGFDDKDRDFGGTIYQSLKLGRTISLLELQTIYKIIAKYRLKLYKDINAVIPPLPDVITDYEAYLLLLSRKISNSNTNKSQIAWCLNYLLALSKTWSIKPFKHQWQAVQFFLSQYNFRCLISDQQGLGKSLSASMCALALQAWYKAKNVDLVVFVMCPASLKDNWVREAGAIGLNVIVYTHHKIPTKPVNERYIIIADEAHNFQTLTSKRTVNFLKMALNPFCFGVIELTGTPIKNGRPVNLFPLLKAIQHPVASNRGNYERRYCDAKKTHFKKWDTNGAINLSELNIVISDKVIRRTKDECMDLPAKIITGVICSHHQVAEDEYNYQLNELRHEYEVKLRNGLISSTGEALIFMSHFRRLSSLFKCYETIQMIENLLEMGESVVVFTEFLESANRMANYFRVPPLTGETPTDKRQKIVDDFQTDINKVFIGTVKAGGVGITLTRASYLIMVDLPYTPGDFEQATDRIHRIGQKGVCNIYTMYAKDIDYVLAGIINQKAANIDKVLNKLSVNIGDKNNTNFYNYVVERLMSV